MPTPNTPRQTEPLTLSESEIDDIFDRIAGNECPAHIQGHAAREEFAARKARAAARRSR